MKTFLTFDISIKNTGWASGPIDGDPVCGSFSMDIKSQDLGKLSWTFSKHVSDLMTLFNPNNVVFEAPILQGKGQDAARALINLAGDVERICYGIGGIRPSDVHNQTLKLFFAGSGHASKGDMIARCSDFGWSPKNDDEADALALWLYGVNHFYPKAVANKILQADMARSGGARA